jgi:hypothetical protein
METFKREAVQESVECQVAWWDRRGVIEAIFLISLIGLPALVMSLVGL